MDDWFPLPSCLMSTFQRAPSSLAVPLRGARSQSPGIVCPNGDAVLLRVLPIPGINVFPWLSHLPVIRFVSNLFIVKLLIVFRYSAQIFDLNSRLSLFRCVILSLKDKRRGSKSVRTCRSFPNSSCYQTVITGLTT